MTHGDEEIFFCVWERESTVKSPIPRQKVVRATATFTTNSMQLGAFTNIGQIWWNKLWDTTCFRAFLSGCDTLRVTFCSICFSVLCSLSLPFFLILVPSTPSTPKSIPLKGILITLILYVPASPWWRENTAVMLPMMCSQFMLAWAITHLLRHTAWRHLLHFFHLCLTLGYKIVAVSAFIPGDFRGATWKCSYNVTIEVVTLPRCVRLLEQLTTAKMLHHRPPVSQ